MEIEIARGDNHVPVQFDPLPQKGQIVCAKMAPTHDTHIGTNGDGDQLGAPHFGTCGGVHQDVVSRCGLIGNPNDKGQSRPLGREV
jgi:hypothetical protein